MSEIHQIEAFSNFVVEADLTTIAEWLLEGLESGFPSKLSRLSEPSLPQQIRYCFYHKSLPAQGKVKFRKALTDAVNDWNPTRSSRMVFSQLCELAALLPHSQAIPIIIRKIHDYFDPRELDQEDALDLAINSLQGLAPHPELVPFFECISTDPHWLPYLDAAVVTLCECQPAQTTNILEAHMSKLLDEKFDVPLILDQLISASMLDNLIKSLPEMRIRHARVIAEHIFAPTEAYAVLSYITDDQQNLKPSSDPWFKDEGWYVALAPQELGEPWSPTLRLSVPERSISHLTMLQKISRAQHNGMNIKAYLQ